MSTIYDILVSDGVVALHLLLTMILLAVVMLRGIQFDSKLQRLSAENTELKRQLSQLSDFAYGTLNEHRKRMDRHEDAILHAGNYLSGNSDFDERYFAQLDPGLSAATHGQPGSVSAGALMDVELARDDAPGPDLSMIDSAFVEPRSEYLEPDVSMPLRASMVTMPTDTAEVDELIDDARAAQTDVMTRVLHRSRGQ